MELRRLEVFVVVAAELNVRRAAQRLGVTQPAITLQLQTLETELGFDLLQRHQQRIVGLTPAGARYLSAAKKTVMQLRLARDAARDLAGGKQTVVKVGICEGVATGSTFWRALVDCLPDSAGSRLAELPPRELVELVADGALDAGFVPLVMDVGGLAPTVLWSEGWVAVLPVGHHLCTRSSLAPADLHGETLVLGSPEHVSAGHRLIEEALDAGRVVPGQVLRATRRSTMLTLASAGHGITFLPESLTVLRMPELAMVPFAAAPLPIGVLTRQPATPVATQFVHAFTGAIGAPRAAGSPLAP